MEERRRARRRRPWIAGGAALSVAIVAALFLASFNGVNLASAASAKAQSFLDLMRQRSPGQRTQALLTKTKHRHHELAERDQPLIVLPPYTPTVGLVSPPLVVPIPGFPEAPVLAQAAPPPVFFRPPAILPPQRPQETPPTAVPEPGTWAMMMFGLGLTGWMLRRDRRSGPPRFAAALS
jgi:PEP-CTERM motif